MFSSLTRASPSRSMSTEMCFSYRFQRPAEVLHGLLDLFAADVPRLNRIHEIETVFGEFQIKEVENPSCSYSWLFTIDS